MHFTSEEKSWLKDIVKLYQSSNWEKFRLNNLIESIFDRVVYISGLFPYFALKKGESVDSNNEKEYARAVQEGYFPIARFVHMLDFLNKEHLILFIPEFKTDWANIRIEGCEQSDESEAAEPNATPFFNIEENTIVEFIRNNINQFVVPTGDLTHLVENEFVSDEDKKFKRQQKLTILSIIVALLIGISSLIINIYCQGSAQHTLSAVLTLTAVVVCVFAVLVLTLTGLALLSVSARHADLSGCAAADRVKKNKKNNKLN
jgi:hypothetical protein